MQQCCCGACIVVFVYWCCLQQREQFSLSLSPSLMLLSFAFLESQNKMQGLLTLSLPTTESQQPSLSSILGNPGESQSHDQ